MSECSRRRQEEDGQQVPHSGRARHESECSRWRQDGDDSKFHIAAEHDL